MKNLKERKSKKKIFSEIYILLVLIRVNVLFHTLGLFSSLPIEGLLIT